MLTSIVKHRWILTLPLLFAFGCSGPTWTATNKKPRPVKRMSTEVSEVQDVETQDDDVDPALLAPEKANEKAPDKFQVKFETTKGDFIVEVNRDWAPNGADRFYNMVKVGFYKDIAVFRAIEGFMFQFGIHGNPKVARAWGDANVDDDPAVGNSNVPGTITFAQTGRPNSRSSQLFINLGNNAALDRSRNGGTPFVPFGKVTSGMDVVNKINTEYGENSPEVQGKFRAEGNEFIKH